MTPILTRRSPNFGPRRDNAVPEFVLLHYTAMESAEAALERLCDPAAEVSCHYLVGRDGRCWRLVDEDQRAWHAGAGSWAGRNDVNSHSIGIELDNPGDAPFSEPLMARLETLLADILGRTGLPPERVLGHSDTSFPRKSDPGTRFDWRRLALGGLSVWPQTDPSDTPINAADSGEAVFASHLTAFGYPGDLEAPALLAAFRNRFRPWARGPLSPADLAVAADLARRFAIDRGAATA